VTEKHVVGSTIAPCEHLDRNTVEKMTGRHLALELV
jgi:hypothetical protein